MRIFVGYLPFTTTEEEPRRLFSGYGEVARVAIMQDRETGRSRGCGLRGITSRSLGKGVPCGGDYGGGGHWPW
jgi:RNA recognition motif-containing protein